MTFIVERKSVMGIPSVSGLGLCRLWRNATWQVGCFTGRDGETGETVEYTITVFMRRRLVEDMRMDLFWNDGMLGNVKRTLDNLIRESHWNCGLRVCRSAAFSVGENFGGLKEDIEVQWLEFEFLNSLCSFWLSFLNPFWWPFAIYKDISGILLP